MGEELGLRIFSGGQSGVDRAALDVALGLGLPCGGWCPAGRRAEDGTIPEHYPLRESPSSGYEQRTEWNILDSDATLVLNRGELAGGTLYTVRIAERVGRPLRMVNLDEVSEEAYAAAVRQEILAWLAEHRVVILNVAGPRESKSPGVYRMGRDLLEGLLREWMESG
jgi:hypothetical protein